MTRKDSRRELLAAIAAQRHWIFEHGETMLGYLAHYGREYGNGIEAIHKADTDALAKLYEMLAKLEKRSR